LTFSASFLYTLYELLSCFIGTITWTFYETS